MKDFDKEFILYEEALALKELGFNEPCLAKWIWDECPELMIKGFKYMWTEGEIKEGKIKHWKAPTYSQAFRWFREKYGLYHSIGLDNSLENNINCDYQIINHSQSISELETSFKSYEEAEIACLKKLIEIVKEKQ